MIFQIALQWMQAQAGQVQLLGSGGSVQHGQHYRKLACMYGLDALGRACAIEGFQPFVAKSDNHMAIVS